MLQRDNREIVSNAATLAVRGQTAVGGQGFRARAARPEGFGRALRVRRVSGARCASRGFRRRAAPPKPSLHTLVPMCRTNFGEWRGGVVWPDLVWVGGVSPS